MKKALPWILLACALGLSGTAAYYSIVGLSKLFPAIAGVIVIMASFMELSKVTVAYYLHKKWKETGILMKGYLSAAVVVLMLITSGGIYGLLNSGASETAVKLEENQSQIVLLESKEESFQTQLTEYRGEKQNLTETIVELSKGLANNKVQWKDKETGQILTSTSSSTRKALQAEIDDTKEQREKVTTRINALNDSVSKVKNQILLLENDKDLAAEAGTLKYISEATGKGKKTIINFFILSLMFVFDPLAIMLFRAADIAFETTGINKIAERVTEEKVVVPKVEKAKEALENAEEIPTPESKNKYTEILENITDSDIDKLENEDDLLNHFVSIPGNVNRYDIGHKYVIPNGELKQLNLTREKLGELNKNGRIKFDDYQVMIYKNRRTDGKDVS